MFTLITAATSAQAYRLKGMLDSDCILLGDYHAIPDVLLKPGKMINTPNPKSNTFIHEMLSFCIDNQVDKVFALRRDELMPLAEAVQLFTEFGIELFVPPKDVILNIPFDKVTKGNIIALYQGEVVVGEMPAENVDFFLSGKITTGIFIVNTSSYNLFTAD